MRSFALLVSVSAALLVGTIAAPAATTASQSRMTTCAANWKAMSADQKKATTYKDYSKSCLAGGSSAAAAAPAMAPAKPAAAPAMAPMKPAATMAAAPATKASTTMGAAAGPAPAGATGQCKDGTYTMSKTHSGACSHHGGVAKWL